MRAFKDRVQRAVENHDHVARLDVQLIYRRHKRGKSRRDLRPIAVRMAIRTSLPTGEPRLKLDYLILNIEGGRRRKPRVGER